MALQQKRKEKENQNCGEHFGVFSNAVWFGTYACYLLPQHVYICFRDMRVVLSLDLTFERTGPARGVLVKWKKMRHNL